jgi:arylsulfatase A-like enzyme
MKYALAVVVGLLLDVLCGLQAVAYEPIEKPNIVLIVADDLGYGDLGSYGAKKINTPNIDRLASEGVRFTDAHSTAAICQPSRYAILSGAYFFRAQRQGKQTLYFHDGQITLPGLLKSAGYRTAAIGKWHLGFNRGADPDYNGELKPGPLEIGFDYFFGTPRTHNEPPFVFVENHRVVGYDAADPIRIVSHEQVLQRGLTDMGWGISEGASRAHQFRPQDRIDLILAEKAVQFLSQENDQPLFLYLAFLAPHAPITPAQEFQESSAAGPYGDYVQQLDAAVGKVLDALASQGLSDKTLVIFTSDNGGVLHIDTLDAGHRANGALLGQKTDAWEGGHRVPFIARWPGKIPAGSLGNQLLGLTDIMATAAAAAEVAVPEGVAPDSINQLPVLLDPAHAAPVRDELLLQSIKGYALRQGEWLYLPQQGSLGFSVPTPPKINPQFSKLGLATSDIDGAGRIRTNALPVQLYNLDLDLFQRWNVAANYPQRAELLGARLRELVHKPDLPVTVMPLPHFAPTR